MTDDLVKELRWYNSSSDASKKMHRAADCIEDLQAQIRIIQSAAKHATKAYKEHLAIYRQKLEEKPPVWHDDIQSLQERDAIMTDRIEKLEAALQWYAEHCQKGGDEIEGPFGDYGQRASKALEGKDG